MKMTATITGSSASIQFWCQELGLDFNEIQEKMRPYNLKYCDKWDALIDRDICKICAVRETCRQR